jgi:hypothetical protein
VADLTQRLDELEEERADDDGMAPSSFVVHQRDWATAATTPIPGGKRTEEERLPPGRQTPQDAQARLAFLAESSRCLADSLD